VTAASQTTPPSRPQPRRWYRWALTWLARLAGLIVLAILIAADSRDLMRWRTLASGRSAKTSVRRRNRSPEDSTRAATIVATDSRGNLWSRRRAERRSAQRMIRAPRRNLEKLGQVASIVASFVTVAAFVVAVAAYVNDRGARRDSARSSSPSIAPTPSTSREGPKRWPSVEAQSVAEAFEHCVQLVRKAGSANGYHGRTIRGVFTIVNRSGTTSLVSDGRSTWACNLKPDVALSRRHRIEGPGGDYEFALARTHMFRGWDVFWGGGTLPLGVVAVTYIFPNGDHVPAQVKTGHWLVQHYSRLPPNRHSAPPIRVLLMTSAGYIKEERELHWDNDVDLCNQVVHSC